MSRIAGAVRMVGALVAVVEAGTAAAAGAVVGESPGKSAGLEGSRLAAASSVDSSVAVDHGSVGVVGRSWTERADRTAPVGVCRTH